MSAHSSTCTKMLGSNECLFSSLPERSNMKSLTLASKHCFVIFRCYIKRRTELVNYSWRVQHFCESHFDFRTLRYRYQRLLTWFSISEFLKDFDKESNCAHKLKSIFCAPLIRTLFLAYCLCKLQTLKNITKGNHRFSFGQCLYVDQFICGQCSC